MSDFTLIFTNNFAVVLSASSVFICPPPSKYELNSTFVFSDIEKVNKLHELNRLDYSSIIVCDGYRYNNKDKNTLKIDIDELRTKAIFKIDFIDNLNSL